MERIVVFNDHANIAAAFQQLGYPLDQGDLLEYLAEGRFLVEAHTFVPIDPRDPSGRDALVEDLWNIGYLVHSKIGTIAGDSYRCDFDVELTLEMMRTAEIVKPDIIVLLSGDKDFVPAILELRRRGIRVEIAGFPGHNAAREVMLKGSGFIDLDRYRQQRWEALETLPESPTQASTVKAALEAGPL
ncbi:LabA-like NYN domain-containing protein [Thiocapsa imhoffii]|nr:NYN domain-containing protein [Thiocapsa imhoffii]